MSDHRRLVTSEYLEKAAIPAWILFYLSVILSLGFAWTVPSWEVPDESAHYLRTFEVSRGHLFNTPAHDGIPISCDEYLPLAFTPDGRPRIAYLDDVRLRLGSDCVTSSRNSANLYSPVVYAIPALAFAAADLLGVRDTYSKLTLGRVLNALACSLIVLLGLGIRPNGVAFAILCVYFSPPVISQIGSLSADAITFAAAFRLALELAQTFEGVPIPSRKRLFALSFLLGAAKPTTGILSLAALSLMWHRPARGRWTPLAAVAGAAVGSLVAVPLVQPYLAPMADPASQVALLIENPLRAVPIAIDTVKLQTQDWLTQLGRPGPGPAMTAIFWLVALATVAAGLTSPTPVSGKSRLVLFGTILLSIGAASASMYLVYSAVGATTVSGVQARYFLPALSLLPILLTGALRPVPSYVRGALLAVPALCSAYAILRLLEAPRWVFVIPPL